MLGSFPPPLKRWSMHFFYPNFQNDMWRIFGLVFFHDKDYFYNAEEKIFRLDILRPFLERKGIALFDTAVAVRRLRSNASDAFLEIAETTDIQALLRRIPQCRTVIATGQKAAAVLSEQFHCPELGIGKPVHVDGIRLFRMPSSSRSYPLPLVRKAAYYSEVFSSLPGMLRDC